MNKHKIIKHMLWNKLGSSIIGKVSADSILRLDSEVWVKIEYIRSKLRESLQERLREKRS